MNNFKFLDPEIFTRHVPMCVVDDVRTMRGDTEPDSLWATDVILHPVAAVKPDHADAIAMAV